MNISINKNHGLHSKLKELIELKSNRDGKVFTVYQLAKAIDMPHSILVKLIHQDPAKRVNNPRIDTLIKIIDFFKSDGFLITVDDFLFKQHEEVEIQSQLIESDYIERKIETFSLDYEPQKIGFINVRLHKNYSNLMAFILEEEINHFFKIGSIFILDKNIKPENENLIAVKIENNKKIIIKKLKIDNQKKSLIDLDNQSNKILLLPTLHYSILGVIIQINAKT